VILTHNELTKLINDGAIEGVKPEQINGDTKTQPSKGARSW
jgi:hypothetical protein